jgi:bisphosphoglycerate-independent phosphoglycerate mutase (AlkP superfamily)
VALRTFDDARRGDGLTHDIDGVLARRRGLDVPERTPAEAAEVFWRLAEDFTLFEHFLADEAGHEQDEEAARQALTTFDAFARAVIARRPADAQVLIVSDHGNVEDLSTRNHTRNRVALLSFGPAPAMPLATVADVGRLVLALLGAR